MHSKGLYVKDGYIMRADGVVVGTCHHGTREDARLWAAAPEMYELLMRADQARTSDLERSDRTWFGDVARLLEHIRSPLPGG